MLCKVYDIFERIEEKLSIDLNDFAYESSSGDEYLKITVSDKTLVEEDSNPNIIPGERIKYICNVALQIQSIYYNMKDKDIKYYQQVLLKECSYEVFLDKRKINPRLKRTNKPKPEPEPESEPESEEEINEDTV